MLQLNEQEKAVFLKLARSEDAGIIKEYVTKLIRETTDIDNLSTDIVKNAQSVKAILKTGLLDMLDEQEVEATPKETWE